MAKKKGSAAKGKADSPPAKPAFNPSAAAATNSGIFGLPWHEEDSRVIIIPVPWEATTSYGGGTSNGPEAILKASKQVDLYDPECGRPYETGIFLAEAPHGVNRFNKNAKASAQRVIAASGDIGGDEQLQGDLNLVNRASVMVNDNVYDAVRKHIVLGKLVGVLGGDHSVSYGAIKAHLAVHPKMGILHIDAHADLREAYEGFTWSHASIMRNVMSGGLGVSKLVSVGIRDYCEEESLFASHDSRITLYPDALLQSRKHDGTSWRAIARSIVDHLPNEVYISFDIDGLDPTLCPHTGTPVPGGLLFAEAVTLLGEVASRRTIVGFDLTEVAPGPDGDEWDANVGARILYKLIGYSLKSEAKR